jgi:hypothetical protein
MIHIIAVALLLLVKVRNVAGHVQAELKLWPASIGHLKISAERPKISIPSCRPSSQGDNPIQAWTHH